MPVTVTETFYSAVGTEVSSTVQVVVVKQDNYAIYVGLGLVAFIVGATSFALRMYVRKIMTKSFGVDDWILVAAFVSRIQNGASEGSALMGCRVSLIRIATAAFFLRVVPEKILYTWHRLVLIGIVALYSVFSIIVGFVLMAQCGTSWYEIDFKLVTDRCFNAQTMYELLYGHGICTAVSDWLMTLVPIIVVFRNAISPRTKRTAAPIILLAAVGGIVSIVRIPFSKYFILYGAQSMNHFMIWLTLALFECCITISATSLVATRPLMQKVFGSKDGERGFVSTLLPYQERQQGASPNSSTPLRATPMSNTPMSTAKNTPKMQLSPTIESDSRGSRASGS
ncbi:hypothetical protein ANO11243_075610 [Dothideomycetidae sp. 11243]|nr:hypothetical protein ANO11243_075610 [fungal sp. No.11243]